MAKTQIITGLDIGSNSIKLLVVSKKEDEPDFKVLFQAEEPSLGVRRGVVIDVERVARLVQILADKARNEIGQKINSVFVNINGSHLFCTQSRGMVAVSRADRNISREDIERVLQEAVKAVSLPSNNEPLETVPKEFIVDGIGEIKVAENLQGSRLETEVLILSCFSPYKNNLVQAVLDAGLQVLDVVPSSVAASFAVLSQRQKEIGTALLDIGAGTSQLAVFREGELASLSVFPIGSANITSDIAVGLRTDIDTAETIKLKLGSCLSKGKEKKEKINIEGEEPLIFSHKALSNIIEARVSEIFEEAQKELKKFSRQEPIAGGVILTGGGASLPKAVELARKELKLPCRLGKISCFPELEEDLSYATVCGLILKGLNSEESGNWRNFEGASGGMGSKIKKAIKSFIP